MDQILTVFLAIIPVYIIIGIGAFLRKSNTLKPAADKGLITIAVHVLMPGLILDKMIGHPAMQHVSVVFTAMALGFGLIAFTVIAGYFAGALFGLKKGSGKRTFGVTTGIQNYGYLAIPLIAALFPDDGAMAVLFVHNVGVEIALWTIAVMLLSGDFKFSLSVFMKGPIIAVLIGLITNFSGAASSIPEFLLVTLQMLGNCALPMALLLVGTTLYDLWGKEKFSWNLCLGSVVLRLILFPSVILATAYFLPLSLPLKQVLVVQSSLPAAMFPIILAKHYNGQVGVAAQVVLVTTCVSVISMPIVLFWGLKLLG